MIRNDYFAVKNSIVDRDDLTIYEKMCCIVLARYAGKEEYDNLLTSDIIAIKMGTDVGTAKKALLGLIEKGLLGFEGLSEELATEPIKSDSVQEHMKSDTRLVNEEESRESVIKEPENKPQTIAEFKERLKGYNVIKDDRPLKEEVQIKQPSLWDELERRDNSSKIIQDPYVDEATEAADYGQEQGLFDDKSDYEIDDKNIGYSHEEYDLNDNESDSYISDLDLLSVKDSELLKGLSDEAKYHLGLLEDAAYGIKPKETSRTRKQTQSNPLKAASKSNFESSIEAKESPRYATSKNTDKEKYHSLIDQVYEIIDENINEREARIILSFADNDIERIKEKYRIAKLSQINDKIEVLINELQRKERKPVVIRHIDQNGEEIRESDRSADIKLEEDAPPMGQINMANLNKMKMYSKFSKNNKTNG